MSTKSRKRAGDFLINEFCIIRNVVAKVIRKQANYITVRTARGRVIDIAAAAKINQYK